MRHRRPLASAVAIASTALATAACGGGSLSMSDLRDSASRVCANSAARTSRIPTPPSPTGAATFLSRGVTVLTPELTSLRKLKPPSNEADVYSTATTAFAYKLTLVRQTLQQLQQGNDPVAGVKALQRRLTPVEFAEDGAWRSLAIPACLNQ